MTDLALGTQKAEPKRKWLSYLGRLKAPAFWNFFLSRVFVARVLPITIFLFLTVNAWGWSYWHWLKRWGHLYWGRLPEFSAQTQLELVAFLGLGAAMFLGVLYLLWKKQYNSFWSAALWRLITTAALILVFANPWISYTEYATHWWNKVFPGSPFTLTHWENVEVAAVTLFGVVLAIAWHYILKKAWQGVGSSKLTVTLVALAITALGWFLSKLGVFPSSFQWQFTVVQVFIGFTIGVCFSLTLIDRFLSGTVGATTTVKEIDADSGVSHDDQHAQPQEAVVEDDAATGHR